MLDRLKENNTPQDYTLSGLNLGSARLRMLVGAVTDNNSLLGLNLSRKELVQVDAIEIANMLSKNKKLQKLELEGNMLNSIGVKTIARELIKNNTTLRYLDLEGNKITGPTKQDYVAVEEIAEMLKENKKLLILNLASTGLNENSGRLLVDAMRQNTTLISLEIMGNELPVEQIRDLQDCLNRNKKAYDEERLREFKERKLMNEEDVANKNLLDIESQKKLEAEIQEKNKQARMEEREKKFDEMVSLS